MSHIFSIATLNLWSNHYLKDRKISIENFIASTYPDILAVQELCSESLDYILASSNYNHLTGEEKTFSEEGNIFFNPLLFDILESGLIDIGHIEEDRALIWIKFISKINQKNFYVFNVHLTSCANEYEKSKAINIRIHQATKINQAIRDLVSDPTEPVILLGDFNEDEHPLWKFKEENLFSVHEVLFRSPKATSPTMQLPGKIPAVDDWIFFRGSLRPKAIDLVECSYTKMPISDHKPLLAVFLLS